MAYAPSEDSDHPGHPPSLIRVFALRSLDSEGPKLFYADSEDWSQADLCLRWSHIQLCWFRNALAQIRFLWI